MVQRANSGHPGAPIGMAPMAHVLFSKFMEADPTDPKWPNRDRFVLSNGHACTLQYSMLHLLGYDVSLEDIQDFRQLHSKTPGHPESHITPGIEVSTGPLGQGLTNAVGMAISQKHLASIYNRDEFKVLDHHVYVFVGDGCLMEGITSEASSIAGHLGLGSLIVLYDDNQITIDGRTDVTFTEDVLKRYEAYGWHTQTVADGNYDLDGIYKAIEAAKEVKDKPSLISVKTIIGLHSKKEDTAKVHGAPLGDEDIAQCKKKCKLDPDKKLYLSDEVRGLYAHVTERMIEGHKAWTALYKKYADAHPDLAAEFDRRFAGRLPEGFDWDKVLPSFKPEDKPAATRKLSEAVLNALAPVLPEIAGGSADLTGSNNTYLACSKPYQKDQVDGRYFHFGVREHAMFGMCNGMAAYGGFWPFASTFMTFIGYAQGSARVAALAHHHVLHIMTHDSIGLGEDGPTHQPIESLMTWRATPNYLVIRPADGNEVSGAYKVAYLHSSGPAMIALTRQNVPHLHGTSIDGVQQGAYTLVNAKQADVVLVATGSEVATCIEAAKKLAGKLSVSVVSMPCWELFDDQTAEYKRTVFPKGIPILSVEAGSTHGWSKYAHASLGIDSFGASAPAGKLWELFGLTADQIADKTAQVAAFYKDKQVPDLLEKPF